MGNERIEEERIGVRSLMVGKGGCCGCKGLRLEYYGADLVLVGENNKIFTVS